jgi:hypothetical protein
MYGELTQGSMDKVCDLIDFIFRRYNMRMDGMGFIDWGAGGNRLAMHIASRYPLAKYALGVECMKERTSLAAKVQITLLEDNSPESKAHALAPVNVLTADIEEINTDLEFLGDCVFMSFNTAFDKSCMKHYAGIWNKCLTAKMLILFTPKKKLIKLGFGFLRHEASYQLSMKGSGEGKTVNIFTRDPTILPQPPIDDEDEEEYDVDVVLQDHVGRSTLLSAEERIRQALVLCMERPREDLLNFLQCTYEEGLKTSQNVVLPNGKVAAQSIRVKKGVKRYGFEKQEEREQVLHTVATKKRRTTRRS